VEFNILVIPLLGGYYFLSESYFYKFKYDRVSDQRLIFNSAIAGMLFLLLALLSNKLYECICSLEESKSFASYFDLNLEYLGISILAFTYAFIGVHLPKFFINREKWVERSVKDYGEKLEVVLLEALKKDTMVSITLKSEKVYVGWSILLDQPDNTKEYVQIIPVLSGYRNSETKELNFVTEYLSVISSDENQLTEEDFTITIRRDQVVSVNFFDINAYEQFHKES